MSDIGEQVAANVRKGRHRPKAPAKKTAVIVVEFEILEDDENPFGEVVDALGGAFAARGLERKVTGTWGATDSAAEGILTVIREWRR